MTNPDDRGAWSTLRRVLMLPLTRARVERRVTDELQFHVDERVEELIRQGLTRDAAREHVTRAFGDWQTVHAEVLAIDARRARVGGSRRLIAELVQDATFAVRTLRRRPVYAATAIVTLALGIGATTAMFTVVNGVLLRDLPYRDPARLVTIYTTFPYWKGRPVVGAGWDRLRTPYPDYQNLVKSQRTFDGVAGFQVSDASLARNRETTKIAEGFGTANLLPLLGVSPLLGRWFLPGEDGRGAPRLVVFSHALWTSQFGGDSSVVGRRVDIDEEPFTVIGVLRPGFALTAKRVETNDAAEPDVWIPFGVYPGMLTPNNHTLELIGRLKPGVSIDAALADATPLLRGDRPATRRGATIVSRDESETRDVRRPILLLFAAVGLLLVITCGNVAMLVSSECIIRVPELATRSVLGAGRARLIRLLMTESAVIATIGATLGLAAGWWGTHGLLALMPLEIPHERMIRIDATVALFAAGVAAIAAVVSGVVPALTLTRLDRGRGVGHWVTTRHSRLQSGVIALQACISVVLMTGAGLLTRSVMKEQLVDTGFRSANILTFRVDLPSSIDRDANDRLRRYDDIERGLRSLPGVRDVTSAMTLPLGGRVNGQNVNPALDEKLGGPHSAEAERNVVAPNYFAMLHIPLLAGRPFTTADVDSALAVAVISQGFARRYWPNENALGKQFRSPGGVATVVGIVADVKNKALTRAPEALFYRPQAQSGARLAFMVQTTGDPIALAKSAQSTAWSIAPGSTVSDITTMDALVHRALAPARYRALLASIFAVLALVLTSVGLAGLTARAVSSRLRELCIRMALGATPSRALVLALARGASAAGVGLVIGILVAPLPVKLLADYLYQVSERDTMTYIATAGAALIVCAIATIASTKRLRDANLAIVLRSD